MHLMLYNIYTNNIKGKMFLTKKNTPQPKKTHNTRALGGWDDNQDDNHAGVTSTAQYTKMNKDAPSKNIGVTNYGNQQYLANKSLNIFNDDPNVSRGSSYNGYAAFNAESQLKKGQTQSRTNGKKTQVQKCYTFQELSQMTNIECQTKVLLAVLQPGGIRVKPNDTLLSQFYNDAKNLDISIIGSLLIAQLYNPDAGFQIKAKSLYCIEYLCKKSLQYSVYFKLHADKIKQSPQPDDNLQSYNKIKKSILAALGALIIKPEQRREEQEQIINSYIDPGYSAKEEPTGVKGFLALNSKNFEKSDKQKPTKKLISPLQLKTKQKKILQGPKSSSQPIKKANSQNYNLLDDNSQAKKAQKAIDLLSLDQTRPPTKNTSNNSFNLLDQDDSKKQTNTSISFDQLLEREKRKKNQFDFVI